MSMCFAPVPVDDPFANAMAASLSHNKSGRVRGVLDRTGPNRFDIHLRSTTAVEAATYSASVVDSATDYCFDDLQLIK